MAKPGVVVRFVSKDSLQRLSGSLRSWIAANVGLITKGAIIRWPRVQALSVGKWPTQA
jgi:hypothetical protein